MDRLTQKVESLGDIWLLENGRTKEMVTESNEYKEYFEKLADYEDAEEQGLLIRLPCKLGDVPYWIADGDGKENEQGLFVMEDEPITAIVIKADGIYISTGKDSSSYKIGSRYALLTREDAELKLKEMEEHDD